MDRTEFHLKLKTKFEMMKFSHFKKHFFLIKILFPTFIYIFTFKKIMQNFHD